MKKHKCEEYRHTEMKYQKVKVLEGTTQEEERVDFNKPVLISFCSLARRRWYNSKKKRRKICLLLFT